MDNIYETTPTKILEIIDEAPNIKRYRLDGALDFEPGQIIEISVPGFGEAPVAPCSDPREKSYFEICVRKVGRLTTKIHQLQIGDEINIRGPYGHGWPLQSQLSNLKSQNLLIVVGGIGLIPLRPFLLAKDEYCPNAKIKIFYGAKTPTDFIFKNDLEAWGKAGVDVQLTIDKEFTGWAGNVGLVTALFDKNKISDDAVAFLCGPPIMYKFVMEKIKNLNNEDIYMSLERRMQCGDGVCQHCAIGPYYTCVDGPVFRYDKIKDIPDAI